MRKFLTDLAEGEVAGIEPAPETPQYEPEVEPPIPDDSTDPNRPQYSKAITTGNAPTFYEGV